MRTELWIALLRNEDGQWIEPDCLSYRRQLVSFNGEDGMIEGTFVFQCYAVPDEDPNLGWAVTHYGVMPFAGAGDTKITALPKPYAMKHGDTLRMTVRVPASYGATVMKMKDPALRYA